MLGHVLGSNQFAEVDGNGVTQEMHSGEPTRVVKKNYFENITLVPHIVSTTPRVIYYENFLTGDECAYLKRVAPTLSGWDDSLAFNSVYFPDSAFFTDEIVNRLEWRIASVTGIMPHRNQESLCIHKITAEPNLKTRVADIHHDKANKPWTTVTVLMYLEDTELGGETVFPCNLNKSTSALCQKSFAGKARWHNGKRTVVEGVIHYAGANNNDKKSAVDEEMGKLREATSEFCARSFAQDDSSTGEVSDSVYIKGVKKEGRGALKVKPKKGSAIVFWHDYPGSSGYSAGDSLAWHTGCK